VSGRRKLDRVRARYLVERTYALGPRSLYHLILDLAAGADLADTLEHYASLSPELAQPWRDLDPPVRVVGGDDA
jgi:hypothetical protein